MRAGLVAVAVAPRARGLRRLRQGACRPRSSPPSATRSPPARRRTTPTRGCGRRSASAPTRRANGSTGRSERTPSSRFRNCGIYGQRTDEIGRSARRVREGRAGADRAGRNQRHRPGTVGRRRQPRTCARWSSAGRSSGSRSPSPRSCPGTTAIRTPIAADPPPERADPRDRPRRARPGAAVLRDARGPAAIRADARGMDVGRRPPLDRGIPAARREGLPGGLDSLNSADSSARPQRHPSNGGDPGRPGCRCLVRRGYGYEHARASGAPPPPRPAPAGPACPTSLDVERRADHGTPAKPPRLLLRFGLYAGVALLVAAAAGTWLAAHNARVERRARRLGRCALHRRPAGTRRPGEGRAAKLRSPAGRTSQPRRALRPRRAPARRRPGDALRPLRRRHVLDRPLPDREDAVRPGPGPQGDGRSRGARHVAAARRQSARTRRCCTRTRPSTGTSTRTRARTA